MEDPKDLSSESDDEDYIPSGKGNISEGSVDSSGDDDTGGVISEKQNKRKKIGDVKGEKKLKTEEKNPEEEKKRKEALWADFMKDCGGSKKKVVTVESKTETDEKENSEELPAKVKEVYEYAGEKVEVEKVIPVPQSSKPIGKSRGGGLAAVLGQLGKKGKLSTLEKSKLDWEKFKKVEGIDEELEAHNKGKNGYLERQDFLQRTDLRQFEIEKSMRSSRRSNK